MIRSERSVNNMNQYVTGTMIKKLREERGLTQLELAERLLSAAAELRFRRLWQKSRMKSMSAILKEWKTSIMLRLIMK